MSWQAYAAVSGKKVGSGTGKLVLLELANHAQADGTAAWPSKATMAETAECDVKTVQRHLRKLEAAGWIRRGDQELVSHYRADRRPVVYDVAMDDEIRAAWAAAHAAGDGTQSSTEHGPGAGEHAGDQEGTSQGTEGTRTPEDGGADCPAAERDDWTECPPVSDATGGQPGPHGGTQLCPPNTQEHPIPPNPPQSSAPDAVAADPLAASCPNHPGAPVRGCKPCRVAKRLAETAAAARLEHAVKVAETERRRAEREAERARADAAAAQLALDRERNQAHLAATKATYRTRLATSGADR